eukprot:TRINITY_DN8702_c0_g1_i1.p3 TRINITY_DN8702_c0_g1~~TRINITY_DN8702_c0_g1_i1.p3  ORF type:complete len:107 (+),score=24.33 TRINITY_DN8702_c0_g1_i1:232-552(+)
MSTITMRIKFPPTYPLIYKTLRVDGTLTVSEAVAYIAETLHVAGGDSIGLYIASLDEWLEEGKPLSDFDFLEDVEEVEFRDRNAPPPEPEPENEMIGDGGNCCMVM